MDLLSFISVETSSLWLSCGALAYILVDDFSIITLSCRALSSIHVDVLIPILQAKTSSEYMIGAMIDHIALLILFSGIKSCSCGLGTSSESLVGF